MVEEKLYGAPELSIGWTCESNILTFSSGKSGIELPGVTESKGSEIFVPCS